MRNKILLANARYHTRVKLFRLTIPILYILTLPLAMKIADSLIHLGILAIILTITSFAIAFSYPKIKNGRKQIKALLPDLRNYHQKYLKSTHKLCQEAEAIKIAPFENFLDENLLKKVFLMPAGYQKEAMKTICWLEATANRENAFNQKIKESEDQEKIANILLADIKLAEIITANY